MLLINIHQLDIILRDTIILRVLKHQVQDIGRVLSLEREQVLVSSSAKDLLKRGEVEPEGDVAVAAVGREAFGFEVHCDEGNVRVVHRLQGDAGVIAVEVAVLDEILDGVDHLFEDGGLFEAGFKHWGGSGVCEDVRWTETNL